MNVYAGSHSSCLLREQTLDFILRFISKKNADVAGLSLSYEFAFRRLGYPNQREHDGHFGEHANRGGQRCPTPQPEETDGYGHGQLKEVGGSNHSCRGGDVVGQAPSLGPSVGKGKDEVGLENERHSNEHDMQRIAENGLALEREENDEREQQPGCGVAVELVDEDLLEILLALASDDGRACDDSGNERQHNKEHNAQKERIVGNLHAAHTQEQGYDGGKGHEDDEVVDSHLHERIGWIAVGQVAPNEHHRRAGRGAQEHGSSQIFVSQPRWNPPLEDHEEEEPRDAEHRERLYEPVDHARHDQPLGVLGHVPYAMEVHFHHHRVDHHPDEDGHGNAHVGILELRECLRDDGQELAHGNVRNNTQQYPQGEVLVKESNFSFFHD